MLDIGLREKIGFLTVRPLALCRAHIRSLKDFRPSLARNCYSGEYAAVA